MEAETSSIYSLPDEVLIMILKRTSYADCNSFMRTCKLYNDLLKSSHSLWRVIYRKTWVDTKYTTDTTLFPMEDFSDLWRDPTTGVGVSIRGAR